MILRTSLRKMRAAQAVQTPAERSLALKDYYFPVPSERYIYLLLFLNWGLAAGFAAFIAYSFKSHVSVWGLLACIPTAFFIADFMSACFHKWLDSYASESNWFWGTSALAFRIHHQYPTNLNETSYIHNVSAFAPFMTNMYGLYFVSQFILFSHPYLNVTVWLLMQLFSNGTEIHKQAHTAKPRAWIRALQASTLFLNKTAHRKHHRASLDSDYGIINGWSNGLVRAVGLWPLLDRFLWSRYKVFPRNWVQAPSEIPDDIRAELMANPLLVPLDLLVYEEVYPDRTSFLLSSTTARSRLSALRSDEELLPHEHRAERENQQMRTT